MAARLVIFFGCLAIVSCVVVRDYNEVQYERLDSFSNVFDKYFTLNGHANTNLFLGVAEPACADQLETAAFIGSQRHSGGNVVSTVSLTTDVGFPSKLEACAEVFFYRFNDSISNPTSRSIDLGHVDLTRWGAEQMPTEITFFNNFDFPIQVWWLEESHESVPQGTVSIGDGSRLTTFLGHIFAARKVIQGKEPDESDPLVDFFAVKENEYHFSPLNRLETCEVVPGSKKFVEGDLNCDDMELRLVEFTHQVLPYE